MRKTTRVRPDPNAEKRATDLQRLVEAAAARFEALSPAEQRRHRLAQKKSWVIGELMMEYPRMSRAEAERLVDEVMY